MARARATILLQGQPPYPHWPLPCRIVFQDRTRYLSGIPLSQGSATPIKIRLSRAVPHRSDPGPQRVANRVQSFPVAWLLPTGSLPPKCGGLMLFPGCTVDVTGSLLARRCVPFPSDSRHEASPVAQLFAQ
jgi:hypothetical protein